MLYRALCRLRLDARAWTVQRLPGRLVTTPQTVHSFTCELSSGWLARSIRLRCYASETKRPRARLRRRRHVRPWPHRSPFSRLRDAYAAAAMNAQYPIRERTSEARIDRRWEIWRSAAPLFEREGYRGVSIEQLAHASALSPAGLYHYFPGKAAIALFPLSHANGLCRRWHAIAAALPRDPFVRLHALIGFAVDVRGSLAPRPGPGRPDVCRPADGWTGREAACRGPP